MQWYRTRDGKLVADLDRQEIIENWLVIIKAAKYDKEAKRCLASTGMLTPEGEFDWAELWGRQRTRIKGLGWTPVRACELPKCAQTEMGTPQLPRLFV